MRYNFSSLPELYNYAIKKFRKRLYSAILDGDQKYTFGELDEKCRQISRMLSNFGVGSYDKVALYSQSMPNWAVSFFAAKSVFPDSWGKCQTPWQSDGSGRWGGSDS